MRITVGTFDTQILNLILLTTSARSVPGHTDDPFSALLVCTSRRFPGYLRRFQAE